MYYVYYDWGRCNDGDHQNGLDVFETWKEVLSHIEKLRKESSEVDPIIKIIQGNDVTPAKEGE